MKRMAAVLAALGIAGAAYATDESGLTSMPEQSYDSIAASDPYEDVYVVEEYLVVPSDTVVLIPAPDEEESQFPG